jgi:hypothetical protein
MTTFSRNPIGDSGSHESGGNFEDEYLSRLQGKNGINVYDKMRRSDSQVRMLLRINKNPILSANWNIEPADDDPQHIFHAQLLNEYFFKKSAISFKKILSQALTMFDFGYSAFEKYYQIWNFENTKYQMPVLEQRLQKSIDGIYPQGILETTKQTGYFEQTTSDGRLVKIPLQDSVFFVNEMEGDDWHGVSFLRAAYKDYDFKNSYMFQQRIGIEKMAQGIHVVTLPEKKIDSKSAEFKAIDQALKNLSYHQNNRMILTEGQKLEVIKGEYNAQSVESAIAAADIRMSKSVLAQFMELGLTGSGTQALSTDQSTIFLNGLQYIVDSIEEVFNKLIEEIININFGEQECYPKLQGKNINSKENKEFAETYISLVEKGALIPTVMDEQEMRKRLRLRELTEEEMAERADEIIQPEQQNEPDLKALKSIEIQASSIKNIDMLSSVPVKTDLAYSKWVDKEADATTDLMDKNLTTIKEDLLKDIESVLQSGNIEGQGLRNIELRGVDTYKKELQGKSAAMVNEGFTDAKKTFSNFKRKNKSAFENVKTWLQETFKPKNLPSDLHVYVLNKVDSVVDIQTEDIRGKAILTAQSNIDLLPIEQIVAEVDIVVTNIINSNKIKTGADNLTTDSYNTGARHYNTKVISTEIQAYRFTNSAPVAPICRSLVGHIYKAGSNALSKIWTPLHFRCKSRLRPIYKIESPVDPDNFLPATDSAAWKSKQF